MPEAFQSPVTKLHPRVRVWTPELIQGHSAVVGNCWIWQGGRDRDGYGKIRHLGKVSSAHRVAFALFNRCEIPAGRFICHTCDTPPCVNPSHLFSGTPADNMADKMAKGRHNAYSKLSEEMARSAAKRINSGERVKDIARDLGVSRTTVYLRARRTGTLLPQFAVPQGPSKQPAIVAEKLPLISDQCLLDLVRVEIAAAGGILAASKKFGWDSSYVRKVTLEKIRPGHVLAKSFGYRVEELRGKWSRGA